MYLNCLFFWEMVHAPLSIPQLRSNPKKPITSLHKLLVSSSIAMLYNINGVDWILDIYLYANAHTVIAALYSLFMQVWLERLHWDGPHRNSKCLLQPGFQHHGHSHRTSPATVVLDSTTSTYIWRFRNHCWWEITHTSRMMLLFHKVDATQTCTQLLISFILPKNIGHTSFLLTKSESLWWHLYFFRWKLKPLKTIPRTQKLGQNNDGQHHFHNLVDKLITRCDQWRWAL